VESVLSLSLRPISPADEAFLYRVYASTREEELALVDWTAAQKDAFLQMQFTAQHIYYQQHYPQGDFNLILLEEQPIGRLYLDWSENEIHIVDIALLPTYRQQGIGSIFLKGILAEGERTNRPVRIYVERFNPALRLYTRLGFQQMADQGVYLLMEWSPEANPQAEHLAERKPC
jgi:ribosomal protein S18 acetylase RimI-like enzyme